MKRILALTAALAFVATSALAQEVGKQSEIVQANTKANTTQQPAAEVPAPVNSSPFPAETPKCTLVTLKLPAVDTKAKPASYSPTIRDKDDGLIDALKACNPNSTIAEVKPGSTKTARITVTQGADGAAYLKLPADRASRLLVGFFVKTPSWTKERYWATSGPVGDTTDIVLQAQDEKSAPKVF